MKELRQELKLIFEQHKDKYKSLYNDGGTFEAQAENGNNFSPVIKSLSDKLISKANDHLEKNGAENKTDIENHLKELIKDFNSLMINPYN
jgi:gas vesicle protein